MTVIRINFRYYWLTLKRRPFSHLFGEELSLSLDGGRVYSLPTADSMEVYDWIGRELEESELTWVLISRLPPRRLLERLDLTKVETHWLTEKQAEGALEPRLERLDTAIRQRVDSGRGVIILEGLEYLIGAHGWDSVLTFVRSLVDAVAQSKWAAVIPFQPLALSEKQMALLRKEAPAFVIEQHESIDEITIEEPVDDITPDEPGSELESHLDTAEDGTPRLALLTRIPRAGFSTSILRRRILAWRRMGLDVSELEPAIHYADLNRAYALYCVVEEKVRLAVELDRVIDLLAETGDRSNSLKFRFRIRQLTGLEEVIRSLNLLLSEA